MKKAFLFMAALIVFSSTSYGADAGITPPPYSHKPSTFEVCISTVGSNKLYILSHQTCNPKISYLDVLPLCRTGDGEDLLSLAMRLVDISNLSRTLLEISIFKDKYPKLQRTSYRLSKNKDGTYSLIPQNPDYQSIMDEIIGSFI